MGYAIPNNSVVIYLANIEEATQGRERYRTAEKRKEKKKQELGVKLILELNNNDLI